MNVKHFRVWLTAICAVAAMAAIGFVALRGGESTLHGYAELQARIESYVADKHARIGVAVIIDGVDTVAVNGADAFPMMSVFKFPQALAVADYCSVHGILPDDTIAVAASEIHYDTWSPMREQLGVTDLNITLAGLLDYSLGLSDNNACDILFRLIGGTTSADSLMRALGFGDIRILLTEADMHRDPSSCRLNSSTPLAMARLFDLFYAGGLQKSSPVHRAIGSIMLNCRTGSDRLPAPLADTDALIGHKTGTGDVDARGRIMALNDAGSVFLPDGHRYAIAVFVADSAYDMPETARIIADISDMVYRFITKSTSSQK